MADTGIENKSLEEIIKERKISGRKPRAGGRGGGSANQRGGRGGGIGGGRGLRGGRFRGSSARGGPGLGRRQNGAGGIQKRRSAPGGFNSPNKAVAAASATINGQWDHDLYQNGNVVLKRAGAALAAQASGPAKLIISNLDFGVNDQDIKGLFQEFGNIRKAAVHYDKSGRSLGTADVVFERKPDAIRALKKYNRVSLDGRPMDIRLTATLSAVTQELVTRVGSGNSFQRGGNRGNRNRAGRGGRGGIGGGRGGRQQTAPKSAADLDAEMDSWKMQTD